MPTRYVPPLLDALLDWEPPEGVTYGMLIESTVPWLVSRVIVNGPTRSAVFAVPEDVPDVPAFMAQLHGGAKILAMLPPVPAVPCPGEPSSLREAGAKFEDAISRIAVPDDDCGDDPIGGGR